MTITKADMVNYLKHSLDGSVSEDNAYISMTDTDIELYLKIAVTRNYPNVSSLDLMPPEYVSPVVLLAKKELYMALATSSAPLFDIGADNNNYLKRGQRFDHYLKLAQQADKEYQEYMENGGAGANTLTSYDVLLPERYATLRNYEKGTIPALSLYADNVYVNYAEISWVAHLSRFDNYQVFCSKTNILDLYNIDSPIAEGVSPLVTILDSHQTQCKLQNLDPNTTYYVVVSAKEKSGLTGYAQITITTKAQVSG